MDYQQMHFSTFCTTQAHLSGGMSLWHTGCLGSGGGCARAQKCSSENEEFFASEVKESVPLLFRQDVRFAGREMGARMHVNARNQQLIHADPLHNTKLLHCIPLFLDN